MEKLPEWPERISYAPDNRGAFLHQRAIAEYWESRCRVAVDVLSRVRDYEDGYLDKKTCALIDEALAAIGPLPESPTTHNQESVR